MGVEETFGEKLKKLREEKHLTLKEVATSLSIGTSMLGKIEKNNRKPNKALIEKISKLFNINGKQLTIAFLSDELAYQIVEEDYVSEVFKVAEEKVKYLKAKRSSKT